MAQCQTNIESQVAYVDNQMINVYQYKKEYKGKLKCIMGHELIFVDGKQIKKHFRHKNPLPQSNIIIIHQQETKSEEKVNHCFYGLMTILTSGMCGICWIGACIGICPKLT